MSVSQKLCCVNSLEMATLPRWVTKLGRGGRPGRPRSCKDAGTPKPRPRSRQTGAPKRLKKNTRTCIDFSTCSNFRHSSVQHVRIFNMFEFCDLAPSCRFHLCSVHVLVYGAGSQNLVLRVCSVRCGVMLGGCPDVSGVDRYVCFSWTGLGISQEFVSMFSSLDKHP